MMVAAPPLPQALDQALRRQLVGGERLLWSAQPRAARLKAGFGIWFFAIPWTVFALFWETMALTPWFVEDKGAEALQWTIGIVFPIFGLPFVLIGFWMLWQPFRAMQKAGWTAYALTDRRLIRVVEGSKRETASVLLDQIGPISRSEGKDGWGHLRIETHSRINSDGDRVTEKFEVLGVPDVAGLERLIMEKQGSVA